MKKIRRELLQQSRNGPPMAPAEPATANAAVAPKLMTTDGDDKELVVWSAQKSTRATIDSIAFFETDNLSKLSKEEKKLSYDNFIEWLDTYVSDVAKKEIARCDDIE